MPRGNDSKTQVFYKASNGDVFFTVFIESQEELNKWKKDSSIPMSSVVAGWQVMVPEHGKQGILNAASRSQLENEFGTYKEEDVVKTILEKGEVQTSTNPERQGSTNDSKGAMVAH